MKGYVIVCAGYIYGVYRNFDYAIERYKYLCDNIYNALLFDLEPILSNSRDIEAKEVKIISVPIIDVNIIHGPNIVYLISNNNEIYGLFTTIPKLNQQYTIKDYILINNIIKTS